MPSASRSLDGTWTVPSRVRGAVVGIAPVMSLLPAEGGGAVTGGGDGISTDAVLPELAGAALLRDCRPSGVGDVIDGVTCSGTAGFALFSAGTGACGAGTLAGFSIAGTGGALPPPSSRFIAILKVPS